ncbi:DUF1924 domain-containing protein [Candidatus Thiothrix anitrata]|uniref:DUF1924 domain-containing protein n=2 Tax=Candidatus Thiothrix anitrata TaxID=2823902 RepID=A0ABX7X671_9GAMM|nr:DUF1924 domain-containing protein [Candidatus Thiothrix anitrata]
MRNNLMRRFPISAILSLVACVCSTAVYAETPQQILDGLTQQAKTESADFQGFDAARGELFFKQTHANDWSCASCHSENPVNGGKHAKTGKAIEPLAPSANAERFTEPKKVKKWFRRNCNDVLERTCTAQEQGDVLTWLLATQ